MKKYSKIFLLLTLLSLTLPLSASAFAELTGIQGLIRAVGSLINPLIAIAVGVALLVFFWGLAKFIFRVGGDEKAVENGKRLMIWGVVALFVMIAVWGIIGFIGDALGIDVRQNNSGGTTPDTLNPGEPIDPRGPVPPGSGFGNT